jgi:hypothetical protein
MRVLKITIKTYKYNKINKNNNNIYKNKNKKVRKYQNLNKRESK